MGDASSQNFNARSVWSLVADGEDSVCKSLILCCNECRAVCLWLEAYAKVWWIIWSEYLYQIKLHLHLASALFSWEVSKSCTVFDRYSRVLCDSIISRSNSWSARFQHKSRSSITCNLYSNKFLGILLRLIIFIFVIDVRYTLFWLSVFASKCAFSYWLQVSLSC